VEEQFTIEAVTLDHGTPCLGFALQERLNVNVVKEGLNALGLPVGPWLTTAKRAVRRGDPDEIEIAIDAETSVRLGRLKERALRVMPGQRVVYLVDMCGHEENIVRAVRLAEGAHQLFIEAAFAEEDAALAMERCHLTAMRAGEIARRAGVRQVIPFHFSPRYLDRPELLIGQVERAFAGGAEQSPCVSRAG
jgi:ribonuclease Z